MAETWIGLRQIDQALALRKGTAFRAFRALAERWREGADFRVLHHLRDRNELDTLRRDGGVYFGSVNAVVLSPERAEELRARLAPARGVL